MEVAKILVGATSGIAQSRLRIPAGAAGLTVSVIFTDAVWDTLTKTVVFRGTGSRIAEFDGKTAVIPWEVLAEPGARVYFGVYGTDSESGVALPLIEVDIGITERASDPQADPGTDPTLPIWAQLQADVEQLKQSGGGSGTPGAPGADGGFYTPGVTQPEKNKIQFAFTPSKADMPAVAPVQVELPAADLTPELKTALVNYYTHVMPNFDDANGLAYINAILTALGAENRVEPEEPDEPVVPDEPETPVVTLTGISATYSGGDVAVGTALTDLTGIEVIATYSDGSVEVVTGYTLSGTIAEGNNTITVSYGGKTATFTVTGVAESADLAIAMSERTSVGSGGVAYSGDSTDTEQLLKGNVGHGWTSEKVFENDTAVHVVLTVSGTTYTNFVAGSAADAVAENDLILYHAVKFGGAAWKNSGDFEIDVTVKAGFRLGVFGSHSCEHVTVSATEV